MKAPDEWVWQGLDATIDEEIDRIRDPYVVVCRPRERPSAVLTISGPYGDAFTALEAAAFEQGMDGVDTDLVFEIAPLHSSVASEAG